MSAGGGARILGCDVGNSRVKFGLFDVPRAASPTLPVCLQAAVFPLDGNVDWDRIANWLPENGVRGLLAGANPVGNDRIQREWVQYTGRPPLEQVTDLCRPWTDAPARTHPACRLLNTAVDAPQRVGVDRLLNAVAANVVREPRQPVVIVDSGTATTVDLVDGDGVFRGGAILPGFELAAKSLRAYTALLPLVTIEELAENPRSPLGTNTQDAICSGLYWGHVGAVRELADRLFETLRREHPESPVSPLVLLTGGGGGLLAEQFPEARWLPHLSLQGLVLAGLEGDVED